MLFESRNQNESKCSPHSIGLVTFFLALAINTQARTLTADLVLCLKAQDNTPIHNAQVVLKGGTKDLLIQADGQDGCYRNTRISFDDSKTYSLEIAAEGYERKTQPLSLAIAQDGEINPGVTVLNTTEKATVAAPSEKPTPSPGGPKIGVINWRDTFLVALAVDVALILLITSLLWLFKRRATLRPPLAESIEDHKQHGLSEETLASTLAKALEPLLSSLKCIEEQQGVQADILLKIFEKFPASGGSEKQTPRSGETDHAAVVEPQDAGLPLSDREKATRLFQLWLQDESVPCAPLGLSDIGGSAPEDAVRPRIAVLEENPSGAVIMFPCADSEELGWAYPNAKIHFKLEALNELFPRITKEMFDSLKSKRSLECSGLEPVLLKRISARQWQVEKVEQ